MRLFTLAATISFAVCRCCGCLGFWVDGLTVGVVATLFMGASSLALAVAFHAMRGMYLHAERLLAKAGRQGAREGYRPPEGRAQRVIFTQEKLWGDPCAAPGQRPQRGLVSLFACVKHAIFQGRRCGQDTGPLEVGAEAAKRL